MGLTLVVGCGLVAFGPSAMLWLFTVAGRPALVITAVVSAFLWLASATLASLIWTLLLPAQGIWLLTVLAGVVLQGCGRLVLARVYLKTERVINQAQAQARETNVASANSRGAINSAEITDRSGEQSSLLQLNSLSSSIAAGVGWGAMHSVVVVGTILTKHIGAGAAFSPSCPRIPSVVVSAFSAQAFVWLDILLMAMAFAYCRCGNMKLFVCNFFLHFLAALTTGFNFVDWGCTASLPLLYGVVALSFVVTRRFKLFASPVASRTRDR